MEDIQFNNKREQFYLIGAGGLSRELECWMDRSRFSQSYELIGYVDDNPDVLKGIVNEYKIVDGFFKGEIWKGKNIVMGIANTDIKQKAFELFASNNCNVLSFIHDTVLVGKNTQMGAGAVLYPRSIISCNVSVGEGVMINAGTQVGHDVTIGNYASIMANVDIGGGAQIGNNVFIGSKAVILPGVKIPDGCRIGAGSVVIKSIRQVGTYFGNPAKKIF